MKRIPQIAKELQVSVNTVIEYCNKLGQKLISPNSKVNQEQETKILQLHDEISGHSEDNFPAEFEVLSTTELPNEFNFENPFILEQQEIISENNNFENRQERLLQFDEFELKTIFSDFEAFSICMGIDNNHAKHIARDFFKGKTPTKNELIEAHTIAMSALEKYGGSTLTFIISLPPLPFKALNAAQIFTELDKRRRKQEFPILRITFKNNKNQNEKIQISYYAEKLKNGRRRNDNVLTIKNRTTGQSLMLVSRNGIVIPERNAKNIIPVLQVFIRFSQNTKQAILNYGLETGECSICGRELTDSESIRIGIGPVCRQLM